MRHFGPQHHSAAPLRHLRTIVSQKTRGWRAPGSALSQIFRRPNPALPTSTDYQLIDEATGYSVRNSKRTNVQKGTAVSPEISGLYRHPRTASLTFLSNVGSACFIKSTVSTTPLTETHTLVITTNSEPSFANCAGNTGAAPESLCILPNASGSILRGPAAAGLPPPDPDQIPDAVPIPDPALATPLPVPPGPLSPVASLATSVGAAATGFGSSTGGLGSCVFSATTG